MTSLKMTINGIKYDFGDLEDGESLLNILRERLELTGTKNGCNMGQCGACTVVVNGKAEKSWRQTPRAIFDCVALSRIGASTKMEGMMIRLP